MKIIKIYLMGIFIQQLVEHKILINYKSFDWVHIYEVVSIYELLITFIFILKKDLLKNDWSLTY